MAGAELRETFLAKAATESGGPAFSLLALRQVLLLLSAQTSAIPKAASAEYKRTWNPKFFTRRMPWYNQRIPSFLTQQAAILEGVAVIRRFLDDYEYENWGVYEQPDMGLDWGEESQVTKPPYQWGAGFSTQGWSGNDRRTIASKVALGTVLAMQATAYIGFARGLTT
jgi:hypothetical protein